MLNGSRTNGLTKTPLSLPGLARVSRGKEDENSNAASHDPGGKVKIDLPDDVTAKAIFSECGKYRRGLIYDWSGLFETRSVLFIGMNPSSATHLFLDPTCNRELGYARRWGMTRYIKGNVCDYRATNPKDLPDPSLACSAENLQFLTSSVDEVEKIILCSGKMGKPFRDLQYQVFTEILERATQRGIPVETFGYNADGSPKHPLYLKKDATLQRFELKI